MKTKKRFLAVVLAAALLVAGLTGCKDALRGVAQKISGSSGEVQEEDTTRWADATADPLIIQGIADASAKFDTAMVDGTLYAVFNGIWSRQTNYFAAPTGTLTVMACGTAEGTQKFKVALWKKVDGGVEYVPDSTYYIKTDGTDYTCTISGLMNTQRKNSLLLLLCAFIWGTAFVAQSAGSGMGACSFLAGRSWLAVLVLLPTVKVFDLVRQRSTGTTGAPKTPEERRCLRRASLVCGTLLFVASAAQQFGLTLNPSTAKAGFLTAMYVVLVPIFGLALGRRGSPQLWLSVAIAVCGLYLLCMQNGFGGVERSDMVLLLCAVLFSFQIMAVNHYGPQMDGVRLSLRQFFVVAVESSVAALLLEHPAPAEFAVNAVPLLYCGVMSSGVAYTLQILGQRDMNPAVGSLIMCLESVFSALGGWVLLHQSLSPREGVGCVLIFAAVVLAQLPAPQRAERAS